AGSVAGTDTVRAGAGPFAAPSSHPPGATPHGTKSARTRALRAAGRARPTTRRGSRTTRAHVKRDRAFRGRRSSSASVSAGMWQDDGGMRQPQGQQQTRALETMREALGAEFLTLAVTDYELRERFDEDQCTITFNLVET